MHPTTRSSRYTYWRPNARGELRQQRERSGRCWRRLPGRAGGYPPGPPTDPDVSDSLIRFLGGQSPSTTLVHHCAALHGLADVVDDSGCGQNIGLQPLLALLPADGTLAAATAQPVSP